MAFTKKGRQKKLQAQLEQAEKEAAAEAEYQYTLEAARNGNFEFLDLFSKPHNQKEVLPDGTIRITLKSKNKYTVDIKGPLIKVSSKGLWNALNRGLVGDKTFDINSMTGVQHKKPAKMLVGYLQFIMFGSQESKGGLTGAVKDENSLVVGTLYEDTLLQELQDYIESYIFYKNSNQGSPNQTIVNQTSNLDEIKKLKELLDIGAITQEEFDNKKKELL